ncbi:MAG: RAMP superfamily CRISPR-associated protein [Nitrospirota bacterium]
MNSDWFMDFLIQIKSAIDKCVEGRDEFSEIKNLYSRIKLLAICLNNDNIKNYAKSGDRINDPKGHKFIIHRKKYNSLIKEEIDRLKCIELYIPSVEISILPLNSFFIQFTFTLAKPYLSKDDEEFYICENPIRKDKVFKVPMVAGSNWKGNLRWTARQIRNLNPDRPDDDVVKRLFGNEKGEEKNFRRGRLNFYPTFFDQIGLEVINPHDRKTKAGTQPIYIESVPIGAKGTFSLLYVPFDLLGKPMEVVKKEFEEDLNLIYEATKEMMLIYGFSAKKSSGFGVVEDNFEKDGQPTGNFKMSSVARPFKNFVKLGQIIKDLKKLRGDENE